MALSSFTPSAYASMAVAMTSARQAVPGGGGATLLVTNLGPSAAIVLLGDNTIVVTPATGIAVLPSQSIALAVGAATNIGAIASQAPTLLNLAQGT